MTNDEEARRVCKVFEGNAPQLILFLTSQLATLKSQGQMLVGLCGLAITVTGFSGAHMIRAGSMAAASMVLGIALILIGLLQCLGVLIRLRWVSQDLVDDLTQTAAAVIARRNAEQRRLFVAAGFVASGLAGYLLAVVLAAWLVGAQG